MDKKIEPFRAYTVREASRLIGSSERGLIQEIKKGELPARIIGKGYKVLGENLLSYLGSPTIQSSQPNVPTVKLNNK